MTTRLFVLSLASSLALHAPAWGHEPGSATEYLRWNFPDPVGLGVAGFATFIGPTEGYVVTHARMHVVFVTDAQVNPADVGVGISTQVDGIFRDWDVHLIDLGISGAPGTHVADIDTDLVNGVVWEFKGWPHSLIDYTWFSGGAHPKAYFSGDSWFELQLEPVPAPGTAALLGIGAMIAIRRRR